LPAKAVCCRYDRIDAWGRAATSCAATMPANHTLCHECRQSEHRPRKDKSGGAVRQFGSEAGWAAMRTLLNFLNFCLFLQNSMSSVRAQMRLQYRTAHMTVSNFRNKYINHWFIYVAHMHERAVHMGCQAETFEKTGQYLWRISRIWCRNRVSASRPE
jgi:hypothetical protein